MSKKLPLLRRTEFERKILDGDFFDGAQINIHGVRVLSDLDSTIRPSFVMPKEDETFVLEISNCEFPDGLEIGGMLDSVTIINCKKSHFKISYTATKKPGETGAFLKNCTLDSLEIDGMLFDRLWIRDSVIQDTEIYLDDTRKRVLDFSSFRTNFLTVLYFDDPVEKQGDWRDLDVRFMDEEDLFKTVKPLTVGRIRTDIPQFAAFVRLLCPTTPICFTSTDMRRLLPANQPQHSSKKINVPT